MLFPLSLRLLALSAFVTLAVAGAAFAHGDVRPERPVSVRALRSDVDRYRRLTWRFERAAHLHVTRSSYSYRRSTDAAYLQWTIGVWLRREEAARDRALARIHRRLSVRLPLAPRPHSRLASRLRYSRRVVLKLRRIYPGRVTRRFASARRRTPQGTLRLWQERLADAAEQVLRHGYARPAVPAFLQSAFLCIHRYEGAWDADTGNGYYGGLQMDAGFQLRYGADFVRRWGTADNWPAWAQIATAARAYQAGRGFSPWPSTARACGLV